MKNSPHVLIIGSGIGGLSTAIQFARYFQAKPELSGRVTVVAKQDLMEGSTRYAQGGIASVWSGEDSFESHLQDTLEAGAGLCDPQIAKICVEEGPRRVKELIEWGVQFTKTREENFDLHQEGGHHHRRILHTGDLTGLEIERALCEKLRSFSNVAILEYTVAVDLITDRDTHVCQGGYFLNEKNGKIYPLSASLVILATGGAGKVYRFTTNPHTSTGDGMAMALRAGAKIANLEFVQFHPTCLYHPEARSFLITEALRGEGAVLRLPDGEAFMSRYHPLADLAPRDVVARAMDSEMKKGAHSHLLLDATHLAEEKFQQHFPNIFQALFKLGIHPSREPIPVVPAAHYFCGGVWTDEFGATTVPRLYAVGETACTGLHGANRLASNSLLEAVVFAERIFRHSIQSLLNQQDGARLPEHLPEWETGRATVLEEQLDIAATWQEIRTLMWNYVGIVRSNHRLQRARERLALLRKEIHQYYWKYLLTKDLIELRNLAEVAEAIVICAQSRRESRGLHYNVDYPERDEAHFSRDTFI